MNEKYKLLTLFLAGFNQITISSDLLILFSLSLDTRPRDSWEANGENMNWNVFIVLKWSRFKVAPFFGPPSTWALIIKIQQQHQKQHHRQNQQQLLTATKWIPPMRWELLDTWWVFLLLIFQRNKCKLSNAKKYQ